MAEAHAYYHIGGRIISPNNRYLVYGEDTVSRRQYTLKVLDLETNTLLSEHIPNTTGVAVWAHDNEFLYQEG